MSLNVLNYIIIFIGKLVILVYNLTNIKLINLVILCLKTKKS